MALNVVLAEAESMAAQLLAPGLLESRSQCERLRATANFVHDAILEARVDGARDCLRCAQCGAGRVPLRRSGCCAAQLPAAGGFRAAAAAGCCGSCSKPLQ